MACLFPFSGSPGGAGSVRWAAWCPAGRRWIRGPRSLLCAAVVVAAASGCEGTAPEVEDPAIVTGKSFALRKVVADGHTWYEATIPHTFTNRTGSKVYIDDGCGGRHIEIEVYKGGEWVHFPSGPRCLIGAGFHAIEPGGVYQSTLHYSGCTSGRRCGRTRLTVPSASTQFRIVWYAWSSVDETPYGDPIGGDLLPLEERVSNHFTFEVVESSR